ncbi:Pyrophosphatase [Fragilaria crotonensis]|nr:Pyrophosphatase [Fragilaria crotonensis]
MSHAAELSDEEMRKLLKPVCTLEQVEEAVQKSFGDNIKVLKALDSYDDQNFMAEREGVYYLVKVHNGFESRDLIEAYESSGRNYDACTSVIHYQTAVMERLHQHGVPTSQSQLCDGIPMSIHSLPVQSESHSPYQLVVKLMTWVPGRTMASLPSLPIECLRDAGRLLGKIHEALDGMDVSQHSVPSQRFHAWDGKNTSRVRDFVSAIDNIEKRKMVESVITAFETDIVDSGVGEKFRKGILQGDFNDGNILVDENFAISGVIDFGDSVESWRILDLSVAMTYALMSVYGKRGRSIAAAAAMLRGYSQMYPVTDVELEHLQLLISSRLACSATVGAFSYKQDPENHYLLLHSQPAWDALELIWGHDEKHRARMARVLKEYTRKSDPPSKRQKVANGDGKPIVTFVTGNKKKLEEVQRILGNDLPFEITNEKVDLPELQGDTIDIAREKCLEAARLVGGPVITEDTSLCFTALNDLPGPYIKWFLEKCGHDGLNRLIVGYDDKSAYAQTVVAFCPGPGKDVVIFDGRTMGRIVPARGKLDFGWDPIFEPDEGDGMTYAEMSKDAKDAISHRSRAMAQLKEYFVNEHDSIRACLPR